MEVSAKKKIDWDDDDPYAIPPEHLPKIKGGKHGGDVEIEEPEHHSKKKSHKHHDEHEQHEKIDEVKKDDKQMIEEEHEHHEKKEKHKKKEKHDKNELETEKNHSHSKNESNKEKSNVDDPLQHQSKKSEHHEGTKEEALYPSLHEIVKPIDDEKKKAHPERLQEEPAKKHKTREGQASCKKCLIQ
jgi:hypothetical protein